AGFILAGGDSSRMGRPKALLEIAGEPIILRLARLIRNATGREAGIIGTGAQAANGLLVLPDDWPGAGPLGGIATALWHSECDWNLILACDLPYLTQDWLAHLIERGRASTADALIPMNDRGAEPLCAMYHRRGAGPIRAALERGTRKVTEGLAGQRIERLERTEWKVFDSQGKLFKNMNSPAEYEEARADFAGRDEQ
ncbi:MAG: molybdenum cofactor guanylyltransferase, partial [Candidatus Acidiferrales bacterium]